MVVTSRSPYTVSASVRGIGVAVMCSTCGARAAALGAVHQRVALLDAEAVLLVDDQQREAGEAHVLLQQRVRADRQPRLAGGDARERLAPLLAR